MSKHPIQGNPESKEAARIPEPRWPALIAIFVTGLVYASLPDSLALGPRWLLVVLLMVLEIPALLFWRSGRNHLARWIGYAVSAILPLSIATSLPSLAMPLPAHNAAPSPPLQS